MSMLKSKIYGCLYGGWCGDAAGATLEFCNKQIDIDLVDWAMQMPGGGTLDVGPGQFTDDSELEISCLYALSKSKDTSKYPIDDVAKEYIKWNLSKPFDRGTTCSKAFCFAKNSTEMLDNSFKHNMSSQANGSLMRSAGIAIWGRNLSPDEIIAYAKQDAQLSHPNEICQEINGLYCLILVQLLNQTNQTNLINQTKPILKLVKSKITNQTIKDWYSHAKSLDNINCEENIGHVKHGFMLVIYFLRNPVPWTTAIKQTLMKGGDTDTNAKIVGSMMGALHGFDSIPNNMLKPLLNFNCVNPKVGHARPDQYLMSNVNTLVKSIID